MDILCQAKSGMGKTAVFVLATLQQIEVVDGQVSVLVMCHTRELAFQISKEYERFSKYNQGVKVRFSSRLNETVLEMNHDDSRTHESTDGDSKTFELSLADISL